MIFILQVETLVREMLDECDLPGENIRVGLKTAELLFKEKVSYREKTTKRDQVWYHFDLNQDFDFNPPKLDSNPNKINHIDFSKVTASLVLLADFVGKDKGVGYMCGSDRNAFIR